MKKLVIPTIRGNAPDEGGRRSDKLVFVGDDLSCGGHEYCAGRRIIENTCNALLHKKGYRGMDYSCVMTMIKVQLDALNSILGIDRYSRSKLTIRVDDVEEILDAVKEENRLCLVNEEPELTPPEAFDLVTDLMLERLYVTKEISHAFFGLMMDKDETLSFSELDPKMLKRFKTAMRKSANRLFPIE